jgi:hypothetical protein
MDGREHSDDGADEKAGEESETDGNMGETMNPDLSPTMLSALAYARAHGNKLVRYPGGFWARENWQWKERPWFGTTTVWALVDRGYLKYSRWTGRERPFPIEATVVKRAPEKKVPLSAQTELWGEESK